MPSVTEISTEARKPLYATVGLGQFAYEQVLALPKTFPAELTRLQDQARVQFRSLPARVVNAQEHVKALPGHVAELPGTATETYKSYQSKAEAFYTELVNRGEKLVGTVRRQPQTQNAKAADRTAVRSAKATATSTKKAAKANVDAVQAAAATV